MSASPVSANPLLSQVSQAPQSAAPANGQQSQAFASVLKQQQSQASKNSNTQTSAQTQSPAKASQTTTPAANAATGAKDANPAESAAAADDATQTALQQLLPWLQAVQGQTGVAPEAQGTDKKDAIPTADTSATDAATALQQAAVLALQGQQATNKGSDDGKAAPESAATGTKTSDVLTAQTTPETASATAKLAATEDTLAADTKGKPPADDFTNALNAAGTAGQTAQTTHASTQSANSQPTQMQSPLGTPQWQEELGNRVQLMSNNSESRAELVLTPPQLGRIEVSLHVSGDQASATFVSANPDVRNALQHSMEHLRQVLADSGISLGQTHVGAESSGQAFANPQGNQRGNGRIGDSANDDSVQSTASAAPTWTRQSNNMLDVFA